MKKSLVTLVALLATITMSAQRFALVDMDYILRNVPAYERANEQLNQASRQWQSEVEAVQAEAEQLFRDYQSNIAFLSNEAKAEREQAIVAKERQAAELRKTYFGPDGELYKKRESLMAPINEEIYNAVKDIADAHGYSVVFDRASDDGIIYASPRIDISNEVLTKLGYTH